MKRGITCSWCHELNDVTQGPTPCIKCGHRADVPRTGCDCRRCIAPGGEAPDQLPLTRDALAKVKEG